MLFMYLIPFRALKCHALSVTVTHFGLLSRTPATHCISHAEKLFIIYFNMPQRPNDIWSRRSHYGTGRNQARLPWSS